MGIILNYKILNIKEQSFQKLNIRGDTNVSKLTFPFQLPLNQNNGFILHSNDYKNKLQLKYHQKCV